MSDAALSSDYVYAVIIQGTSTPTSTLAPLPVATGAGSVVEPTQTATPIAPYYVISGSQLSAFIEAPSGLQTSPYVILSAFQAGDSTAPVKIRGTVDTLKFTCPGTPCILPISNSTSTVIFQAYTTDLDISAEVTAIVNVEKQQDQYSVKISSLNQVVFPSDACANIWNLTGQKYPEWASVLINPAELNTNKKLYMLAAKLITYGVVDTSGCPSGGLYQGMPTTCGLEKATEKMIEWQNQYDFQIWLIGRDYGLPSRLLKTLIEIESQFWPTTQRYYLDEIGLAQISQLGMDVLLRRDPLLYQSVCSSVLPDCRRPYAILPESQQAMIRGALVSMMDASCPSCPYGVDLERAKQSLPLVAMVLKANCMQVKALLDEYDELEDYEVKGAGYEDLWKFTMVSYHSGIVCLQTAVEDVAYSNNLMDWRHVRGRLECPGAREYVDRFWNVLESFDRYRLSTDMHQPMAVEPAFEPTQTPVPTPTPVRSSAQVLVWTFADSNGNGLPEAGEWMDNIPVQLTMSNGVQLSGVTRNGSYMFNLTGYPVELEVEVSLPGLYRSNTFYLPEQGVVPVLFVFSKPELPKQLP